MRERAVVLGSGVNALVAAHCLARAGRTVVLVPEAQPRETDGWLSPQIARHLELERHGLEVTADDPWIAASLDDGGRLELWRDPQRSAAAIRKTSAADAARWPQFCARMAKLSRFLEEIYLASPPDPLGLSFALRARRLGREALTDLMRTLPMSVADLLDDWFESDALKGLLGAAGVARLLQGPRSGGTALRFLHHHVGSPPGVFRPPRSNLHDVLLRLSGLDVRPGSSVEQILVRDNRVAGVALKGGEEVATPIVVSALDPRRTMLELADPGWLDPELARSIRHIRCRGTAGRLTLELDRPPGFARLVHAPSLDYLERAYDDAKHGRPSAQPCLEACWDGGTRVEIDVQFAAEAPDAALGLLAPRLGRAAVKARQWIPATQVPASAELTLDQALWRRPHPDLAAYHTPIAGLWLCGDSMHPGDRIAGAAGFNCARGILRSA